MDDKNTEPEAQPETESEINGDKGVGVNSTVATENMNGTTANSTDVTGDSSVHNIFNGVKLIIACLLIFITF